MKNMEKGFFKVFNPANSSKRLKIPTAFTDYKNGKLPNMVSLRDRFGNMWPIGVAKTGKTFYFEYEWEKFIEENTLEFGDFLIFDYDGMGVFDFKLLGKTCCEKKGVGGLKLAVKEEEEEEEMNFEHQKREEPKGKRPGDSSSSEDSDEDVEDFIVEEIEEEEDEECDVAEEEDGENEEEENERATIICKKKVPHSRHGFVEEEEDDEQEEEENQRASIFKKKVSRSKRKFAEEEDDDDDEDEERDEETEEEEEEKEDERAGTFKKEAPCSKAGCKRTTVPKVREYHDRYGTDIFRSGRATQPKNPYFVAKIRAERRDQLYVPIDVLRDYKLELPSRMTICDSSGREFETKLKTWKDGRIWLQGGWRNLCRWNLVGKNDRCICEFVRGKGEKGLHLQVQVLYEGAGSHASKKKKK